MNQIAFLNFLSPKNRDDKILIVLDIWLVTGNKPNNSLQKGERFKILSLLFKQELKVEENILN